MSVNIVCDGPGPHQPASGIVGTGDRQVSGMRCPAPACVPVPDQATQNASTIDQRAQAALTANATFLALASPTNAQVVAQVQRLTKENNAIIRRLLGLFADISDTA